MYNTFKENILEIKTDSVVIICAVLLFIILHVVPTIKEPINGRKIIIKIYVFNDATSYPFKLFIFLMLTVPRFLNIITNIASPIAASTAATDNIKNTKIWPV